VAADEQPSSSPQEGGSRGNYQQRAQQRLDQMTTTLALTQVQAEKVKAIMQDQFGAMRAQTQGMSREDRRAAFQKAREAVNAKIAEILMPDQQPKWEEYQKQMEARRAQRGQGGSGGGWGGGGR
jgi:Spy/CpxP family protein refolding chaperone